jgi:hypothetical protein
MNEKLIRGLVTTLLLLVIVTVGSGILFIYQQFPQLDNYDDTQLVNESLQTNHAPSLCLATISHRQTLYTTQSDGVIWQRTSEQWQAGEKRILGNGGEAQYQRNIMPFVTIRSRMFFHSTRPRNIININNQLILQLPEWLCRPSSHPWHNTPVRHVSFPD